MRAALRDGGAGGLIAFAEELGGPRLWAPTALELGHAAEQALLRVEEALELQMIRAFERPVGLHAGPGIAGAPEAPQRERAVFRSALTVQVVDEAGKPVQGAHVAKDAAGVGMTAPDGGHVIGSVDPGTYAVEAVKEGYRAASTSVKVGADQSVGVRLQLERIQARLVWPATGASHKQYVNLDRAPVDKACGNVIQVQVGVRGGGKAGDKLFLKVEWDDAKVSKRNSPVRRVVNGVTAPWCPKSGAEVTLRRDGEEPIVEVDLGLAGGDELKVSVGGTTECKDASCTITTWRKLWYEIMAPDLMQVGADLGAGHRARIDQLLLPCFVEYRVWKSHVFPESAAPAGTVFDASYFPGSARKQFVLTDHTFTQYPSSNGTWDGAKRPRSVGLRLCDKNYFNDAGIDQLDRTVTTKTSTFNVRTRLRRFMLPRSAHDGSDAIKQITWTARIDPARHPNHPAVQSGAPRTGTLGRSDVRFLDITRFEVEWPDGTATVPGPGRLVGPETANTCPIFVYVEFEAADEALGLSGQGAQRGENLVCYKNTAPESTVDVTIHELCHSAGMAAISGNAPPPGIPQPKTTAQVDPDNQCSISSYGHLYVGHGHSGGHCARGLNDADKAGGSYGGMRGTCINFGETELQDPSPKSDLICKTCSIILKGRELQSV